MQTSPLFGKTLRDAPTDAEIASHRLLIRGAFMRQVAAGVYAWLPLGLKVLQKIERIIREEMDSHGGSEILMPGLLPADLLEKSGRRNGFGVELYTLTDPADREWYLGPTHEEVVTFLASTELNSYKDLPSIPYQIQWKFRYAPRPRGGLLRGREFLMKDAYSFDADEAGLKVSYDRMTDAYKAIFARCGINTKMIEAQAGVIGGTVNHEFIQPAPAGEDTFVSCDKCDYAANTEAAVSASGQPYAFGEPSSAPQSVHTPGLISVADVASALEVDSRQLVKALVYTDGDQTVCALIPGDRELNEYKLGQALGGVEVRMLDEAGFASKGLVKGFTGPVALTGVRLLADVRLRGASNVVVGANESDHHLTGVVEGRDFTPDEWADLVVAQAGDTCQRCGGTLSVERGIEVGHVFQLGTKYSDSMGATFADATGQRVPFVMGCYGLGVSRVVASIVETHHDDRGVVWPRSVAPFEVVIIVLADAAAATASSLADELRSRGVTVAIDDRAGVSAGVKFADADLIGYPLQVVAGKTLASDGTLEVKARAHGERIAVQPTVEALLEALDGCP